MLGSLGAATATLAAVSPQVAVITEEVRLPGDHRQEIAAEMAVLIQLARLQDAPSNQVGVIGVGNRHGVFHAGTHRALSFAASQGMLVVRLAANGAQTAPAPTDTSFIDGGRMGSDQAADLLAQCLERFGPLPAEPDSPAGQAHRQKIQAAFDRATGRS